MLPPASKKNSIVASLRFANDPLGSLWAAREKLGDVFKVNVGFRDVYVVSTPEGAKHILQTNNKNYIKDKAYQQLKMIVGNGLLTSEGDTWFRQRRLASPAFYKDSLPEVFRSMGEVSVEFLDRLEGFKKRPESFNISKELMGATLEIVMKGLFSTTLSRDVRELHDPINYVQEYVITRIRRPYRIPLMAINGETSKYKREHGKFKQMILDVIKLRKENNEHHKDLLDMFMAARDEDTGEGMSDQQLVDECLTMVGAGHETSASALGWTIWQLTEYPDIWAKIKEEADRVFGNGIPSFEQVMQLNYTRQVLEESMRLYPPAWTVGRENLQDDVVDGYEIPAGKIILVPIFAIHRDKRWWPDPEKFDPHRFDPEPSKARNKFHYFPFGAGPRMCIGNHFAMMEMQLLLSLLAQRFSFQRDENHPVTKQALITLRPKDGIHMFIS